MLFDITRPIAHVSRTNLINKRLLAYHSGFYLDATLSFIFQYAICLLFSK